MKKVYPEEGAVRTVRRFLWLPKTKMVQVSHRDEERIDTTKPPYVRGRYPENPCDTPIQWKTVRVPIDTRVRRWWEWASWTEKYTRDSFGGCHWSASNWWADMPYEGDY